MRLIDADIVDKLIAEKQAMLESADDKMWESNKRYHSGLAIARRIIADAPTVKTVDTVWHKVIKREPTEDERKEYLECGEICPEYFFNCAMPDDGDEILIATAYGVDKDVCGIDDGYYLESYEDWDSVLAWAYLPKYEVSE